MAELSEVGFDRPKIRPLHGTVKFYQRHLLVCTGQTGWPAEIENIGGFIGALAQAMAARAKEMPLVAKLTACDEPNLECGWDVLVFPDMIRYVNLANPDVTTLVEEHLVGNRAAEGLRHEPIDCQYVFVCCHAERDPRCGACGPVLADLFASEVERRGLGDQVVVRRTSHLGGHEYAGNVIVYPNGTWYGYVVPEDVPRIVEEHLVKGQTVEERRRGRMGERRE